MISTIRLASLHSRNKMREGLCIPSRLESNVGEGFKDIFRASEGLGHPSYDT